MPTNDWLQLCDDIDDGEFDSGLEEIAKAVASRRDIVNRRLARRLQRSLNVGDRVRLTNKISPRYLEGCVGTIKQIRDGAAVVHLDKLPTSQGRGRPRNEALSDKLLVEFMHLEKLDDDVSTPQSLDIDAEIGDDEEYEDDAEELDDDDD